MPILKSDPAILDLEKFKVISPDLVEIAQRSQEGLSIRLALEEIERDQVTIAEKGGQHILANYIQNVGIPKGRVFDGAMVAIEAKRLASDFMRSLIDMASDLAKDFAVDVLKNILPDITSLIGTAVDSVSSIPILGAVVKIATFFVKAFKAALDEPEYGSAENIVFSQTLYNPEIDWVYAAHILDLTKTKNDWTGIFLPPCGLRPNYSHFGAGASKMAGPEGRECYRVGYAKDPTGSEDPRYHWIGVVPGTDRINRHWEWVGNDFKDTGSMLPTARQIGAQCWGTLLNEGPTLFCINADKALNAWITALNYLREWLRGEPISGRSNPNPGARKYFSGPHINKMLVYFKEEFWGLAGGTGGGPVGGNIYGPWKPDMPYEERFDINNSIPVKSLEKLRERQWKSLDTINVAYITPGFGAFKQNSDFKDRLELRKRQLLDHPAKYKVDINNVPDFEYKKELEKRGVTDRITHIAAFPPKEGVFGTDKEKEVPEPEKLVISDIVAKRVVRSARKKSAGATPLLAVLGIAALVLSKRGK